MTRQDKKEKRQDQTKQYKIKVMFAGKLPRNTRGNYSWPLNLVVANMYKKKGKGCSQKEKV